MARANLTSGDPLPGAAEMQQLDRVVMKEQGVSSIDLMERVSREFTRSLTLLYREKNFRNRNTVILVGPGNNGGDGLVVARCLHLGRRIPVATIVVGTDKRSADCEANLERLLDLGARVYQYGDSKSRVKDLQKLSTQELDQILKRTGVLIDSLLGTGQSGELRGNILSLLKETENYKAPYRIALDVPTGVSSDTGACYPHGFNANLTLTVQHKKLGMTQEEARERCGEVRKIFGGLHSENWSADFQSADLGPLTELPPRISSSHKGNFGHLLILAGSKAMPGAGVLAAMGALSTGVGKVTATSFGGPKAFPPEAMTLPVKTEVLSGALHTEIASFVKSGKVTALVLGPGIGTGEETKGFVMELITVASDNNLPLVLDADALNLLSELERNDYLGKLDSAILTPHPGEGARLVSKSTSDVQSDRPSTVKELSTKYGATVLLKGAGTLIWNGREGRVNETGTPHLATGGSGDVLSGIIGGLAAQGLSPFDSGTAGAWLHGKAAELFPPGPLSPSSLPDQVKGLIRDECNS